LQPRLQALTAAAEEGNTEAIKQVFKDCVHGYVASPMAQN